MKATGTPSQDPRAVAIGEEGDVMLAGQFNGTISFGGTEISSTTDAFEQDIFAVRLTGSDGGHVSSLRVGSRAEIASLSLAGGWQALPRR